MIRGIFSSQSGINAERQDSFNSKLMQSELAGTAPIYALSAGSAKFPLVSKIHYWFIKKAYSNAFKFVGAVSAASVTVTVDKGSIVEPQSIIVNTLTGEYMLVTAVAGNNLTVTRGFADTTASAIADASEGLYLGTAKMEGSLAPMPKFRRGVPRFNYSQIFRNGWGDTRSSEHIKYLTGNKAAENRNDAIAMHAQDIEMAVLMGKKSLNQVNDSEILSTMDGLMSMVDQNIVNTTALTLDSFMKWLYDIFATNVQGTPNERVVMTSREQLYNLNKLIRESNGASYELSTATKVYGLDVQSLQLPGLPQVKIFAHPLFSESDSLKKSALCYHPGLIKVGYMTDAETKDATQPGMDGTANVITSELTIEYADSTTGGVMSNMFLA